MFLYRFLRFWVGGAMRLWFKKIYFKFDEELPENAPLIFACTHPNSAIDYIFLPLITRKRSFVMVRGDVFENKWLNKIFRALWMLPVYRMRDGYGTLNKNTDSFAECFSEFDKKGRTLIFSEGTSVQAKTLNPLKKGTARLALDYLEADEGREIYIVPMANNYSRFRQFRGTVTTYFAKPIKVSNYRRLFKESRAKAYTQLTKDVFDALDKTFIQVRDYEDDGWTERALNVLRFNRLEKRKEWILEDIRPYKEEKQLVDVLNRSDVLSEDWKQRYENLNVNEDLEGVLKRSGRKDVHAMIIFSMSLIVALANVIHFLPYQLSHWIARNKIKDELFENTIMTLGSALFYLAQFAIVLFILGLTMRWNGVIIACSMLAVTVIYSEVVDDYRFAVKCYGRLKFRDEYARLYNDLITAVKAG